MYSGVTEPYIMDLVVRGDMDPIFSDFVPHAHSAGDRICFEGTDYRVEEVEWVYTRGKFSGAICYIRPIMAGFEA